MEVIPGENVSSNLQITQFKEHSEIACLKHLHISNRMRLKEYWNKGDDERLFGKRRAFSKSFSEITSGEVMEILRLAFLG